MIYRILVAIGVVLIILGVLKFVGIIALVAAGAVALIVIGILFIVVAQILFGPSGTGLYARRRL